VSAVKVEVCSKFETAKTLRGFASGFVLRRQPASTHPSNTLFQVYATKRFDMMSRLHARTPEV
jgi:hypothetical protein